MFFIAFGIKTLIFQLILREFHTCRITFEQQTNQKIGAHKKNRKFREVYERFISWKFSTH